MAWTNTHAIALNTLLRIIANEPDLQGRRWRDLPEDEQREELVRCIGTLAEASNKRLGAGYGRGSAERLAVRVQWQLTAVHGLQQAGLGLATVLEELRTDENDEVVHRAILDWAAVNVSINGRGQNDV